MRNGCSLMLVSPSRVYTLEVIKIVREISGRSLPAARMLVDAANAAPQEVTPLSGVTIEGAKLWFEEFKRFKRPPVGRDYGTWELVAWKGDTYTTIAKAPSWELREVAAVSRVQIEQDDRYIHVACHQWAVIAGALTKPWPRRAVEVDLVYLAAGPGVPGRAFLMERWGWTEKRTRRVLEVAHV